MAVLVCRVEPVGSTLPAVVHDSELIHICTQYTFSLAIQSKSSCEGEPTTFRM